MKKTILITGTSSGIGAAVLRELSGNDQFQVIALTRSPVSGKYANNITQYKADVSDTDSLSKLLVRIQKNFPIIDVLINNAGQGYRGSIESSTLDEIKEQFTINAWPALELTRLILPIMRKQGSGQLILVSTLATSIDYPTIGYYGAVKGFVEKTYSTLRLELKPWNIKVSTVTAGAVKTHFGRSMKNIASYEDDSLYHPLYTHWSQQFALLFRKAASSDEAAKKIVKLTYSPKDHLFIRKKDRVAYLLRTILGSRVFNSLLLKLHMKG